MASPENQPEQPKLKGSLAERRTILGPTQVIADLTALQFDLVAFEEKLGGVTTRARELAAQLRPMVDSLTPEQLVQSLNILTNLDYYFQLPTEPGEEFDHQGLIDALQGRLYGGHRSPTPQLELDRFGGVNHPERTAHRLRWLGAPIDLYLGDFSDDEADVFQQPHIRLQQDGEGSWWYSEGTKERHKIAPGGQVLGRETFDPKGRAEVLRMVSKQHLVLIPDGAGGITILDTSTNGTRMQMLSYPFE